LHRRSIGGGESESPGRTEPFSCECFLARFVDEDIHDIACGVGGFGNTEELPAYNGGEDRMLGVNGLHELEQFRMVASRSGDEVLEEQANAGTACLHDRCLTGCALRVECAGICDVLCEDIAYDSGQLGLVSVKDKDR
jgi:hypothetical protein